MKKIVALSAILCLISVSLKAQESDYVKVKPNELSFGFYNVFQLNNSNNIGLLYKRTIKNGAIRIGSSFYTSKNKTEDEKNDFMSENLHYSLSPSIGYEFHSNIKRWQVFYGVDLTFSYSYRNTETKYSDFQTIEQTVKNNNYGTRPLVGVKYRINTWLSVATETGLAVTYHTSNTIDKGHYSNPASDYEHKINRTGFSADLEPLGVVSVNFQF